MPDDKSPADQDGKADAAGTQSGFGQSPFAKPAGPSAGDKAAAGKSAAASGGKVALRSGGKPTPSEKKVKAGYDKLLEILAFLTEAAESIKVIESVSRKGNESPRAGEVSRRLAAFGAAYKAALEAKEDYRGEMFSGRVEQGRQLGELLAADDKLNVEAAIRALQDGASVEDAVRAMKAA